MYLARFGTHIDIPHVITVHSVHDLHSVRAEQFWRIDNYVDPINLHAPLGHFRLETNSNQ